jgi:hypothetical protein
MYMHSFSVVVVLSDDRENRAKNNDTERALDSFHRS